MKKAFRGFVGFVLKFVPDPNYVYNVILKPRPLRYVTDKILSLIISESVTLPEGTLYLNPADPGGSASLALGKYELFETQILRSVLHPGMSVVNIGANIGYYVVVSSKHVGESGKVLAFEPDPRLFAILSKSASALKNVEIRQEAVSDKEGQMTLYLSDLGMRENTLVPVTYMKNHISVKTVPLDSLIQKVDLIIMDIEGAEPFAFAGMSKLLDQKNMAILCELNPKLIKIGGNDPVKMLTMLASHGFEIYNINAKDNKLEKISDFAGFVEPFTKNEELTNIYCAKGTAASENIF